MTPEIVALLGVAVTVQVAAISALWRLVVLVGNWDNAQTEHRHKLRQELTNIVIMAEERCTRRIEALERHSNGFQEHQHRTGRYEDGDG